jgi:hypothetical protein
LYDYEAATDEELSVEKGEKIIVVDRENNDWWFVRREQQGSDIDDEDEMEEGYIPRTFVKVSNINSY